MVRVKLSLLIVFTIGALVALGSVMTDNLSSDLEVSAIDQLNASNDVVRLADTVVDYSLMFEASEVSRLDGLVEAVGCWRTTPRSQKLGASCPTRTSRCRKAASAQARPSPWSRARTARGPRTPLRSTS